LSVRKVTSQWLVARVLNPNVIDGNGYATAVGQNRREELPPLVDLIAVAFEDDLAMLRDRRGLLSQPFFRDPRPREDRNLSR
jgi:hypothetical protein